MAFTLAKGHYPRKDIWDGGERLSMYELQERAKTGDMQTAELIRELEIGKRVNNAPLRWSDEPIYQDLKAFLSNEQYLNQAKPKTPQEWLAVIEPWVIEHGRFPSDVIKEETQMYHGAFWAIRYNPQNPASIRLKELQKKYTSSTEKTPQEWLAVIEPWVTEQGRWPSNITAEEKKMYQGAYHAMNLRANDPASMRLKALKEKYQGKPATPKTQPAEDLLDVDDKDAVDAVTLAEKYLDNPEIGTDEYINNLLQFYDKLDPFVTGK